MLSSLPAAAAHAPASIAAFLCLLLSAFSQALPADGFMLRDDLHRDIEFAHSPKHIISLLPSLTETVCALGGCDRLVATDRFSNWPEQVNALPKMGGLDDASIEAIVSLRPDLILISRSQRMTERLRELGLQTFAIDTQTYADVARSVAIIGALLGDPVRATLLTQTIDDAVRRISGHAIAQRRGEWPRVYFEVDRAPYAAGPKSFIGELLARLGTRNIVTPDLGIFPKLNPEYVVRHDPDVIFLPPAAGSSLAARPGWQQIRAIKDHRVCAFSPPVYDTIVRPGPRVAEGMQAIADCLARVAQFARAAP